MANKQHIARVRSELIKSGVTRYGLSKLSSRYVPEIIGLDEHIGGVVYGRANSGSGMLVATDRRVIFIDRKPFFTTSDELTYDVVSGVKIHTAGPFCTVELHTRIKDYAIRYVNADCAKQFVKYLEYRRISPGMYDHTASRFTHDQDDKHQVKPISDSAHDFIRSHQTGVLSTVSNNTVHSSVVNYVTDEKGNIYFVTTPDSRKLRFIAENPKVALTIFELETEITVRIEGFAAVEENNEMISNVVIELSKRKTAQYERFTQNVREQSKRLVVLRVEPVRTELTNYGKR